MNWIIDGRIDMTGIANAYEWHLGSVIESLVGHGLDRRDAETFADFLFCDRAAVRDRRPEDCITAEQWSRLSVA